MTVQNTDSPHKTQEENAIWQKGDSSGKPYYVFSKLVFFHTSKTGNKILKMVNTALSNVHLYLSGKNVGKTTNAVYWTFKNVSRLWINDRTLNVK